MSDPFAQLSPADRDRAAALAAEFRRVGAEEPEAWAASEVADGIPHLARFILLRRIWRSAAQWTLPPADWFAEPAEVDGGEDEGDGDDRVRAAVSYDAGAEDAEPAFHAAQQAVRRMLAAGADPDDLREVARAVFLHTAFDAVLAVDEGHDPDAGDDLPGWLLIEIDAGLQTTGRAVDALHEDLLTTEPDGG